MPRLGFRRSRRARLALVLAVLWIVSFELGPLLHIAEHDRLPPHHHTALGIVWDDPGAQDAALHEVLDEVDSDSQVDEAALHVLTGEPPPEDRDSAVAAALAPAPRPMAPLRDPAHPWLVPLQHGAHSLAHHGLAVPAPAPPVTRPLPTLRRVELAVELAPLAPSIAPRRRAVARGPPAVSSSRC